MTEARERYRKLPGHRRGFFRGSSVWLGSDHLLLVKSYRVREEYKRFQLADVQSIVIARCPRFHLSTRSALLALIWWLAYAAVSAAVPRTYATPMLFVPIVLFLAWSYVSLKESCRCTIQTAVSRDELPSVYRTWTAQRFLRIVGPRIAEVQGALESNWVEMLEGSAPPSAEGLVDTAKPAAPKGYLWSGLFTGILVIGAIAMLVTLHASASLVTWLAESILAIEMVAIAGMFVQYARGSLPDGMRWLAIIAIVKTGLAYYTGVAIVSVLNANGTPLSKNDLLLMPQYMLLRQIDAWSDLALGVISSIALAKSAGAQ